MSHKLNHKKRKKGMSEEEKTITPEENKTADVQAAENAEAQAAENAETQAGEEILTEAESKLKGLLDEALQQKDEFLTLAQRVQADFDNFRRRNKTVQADAFEDGAKTFAATLLPCMDNLERALAAAENSSDAPLKSGVEMTLRQMQEAFIKRGITEIECLGQKFDPNLENAVMQGTPEEGEPGTVCAVFQKGYKMGDSVLRHAMVKVVP